MQKRTQVAQGIRTMMNCFQACFRAPAKREPKNDEFSDDDVLVSADLQVDYLGPKVSPSLLPSQSAMPLDTRPLWTAAADHHPDGHVLAHQSRGKATVKKSFTISDIGFRSKSDAVMAEVGVSSHQSLEWRP